MTTNDFEISQELTIKDVTCTVPERESPFHHDCLQAADILKSSIENPGSRINVMKNQALQPRMTENKQILCQIVSVIIFLGK